MSLHPKLLNLSLGVFFGLVFLIFLIIVEVYLGFFNYLSFSGILFLLFFYYIIKTYFTNSKSLALGMLFGFCAFPLSLIYLGFLTYKKIKN